MGYGYVTAVEPASTSRRRAAAGRTRSSRVSKWKAGASSRARIAGWRWGWPPESACSESDMRSCDGTCRKGGSGGMISPVVRYLFVDGPRATIGRACARSFRCRRQVAKPASATAPASAVSCSAASSWIRPRRQLTSSQRPCRFTIAVAARSRSPRSWPCGCIERRRQGSGHAPQAPLAQEWVGIELTPVAMALPGTAANRDGHVSTFQAGLGGNLRFGRHRWESVYAIPLQAGLFVSSLGTQTIFAHIQTEGGFILPGTDRRLELGVGVGVGILAMQYATGCDGSCDLGGSGWLLSLVARFLIIDGRRGRWSARARRVSATNPEQRSVRGLRRGGNIVFAGLEVGSRASLTCRPRRRRSGRHHPVDDRRQRRQPLAAAPARERAGHRRCPCGPRSPRRRPARAQVGAGGRAQVDARRRQRDALRLEQIERVAPPGADHVGGARRTPPSARGTTPSSRRRPGARAGGGCGAGIAGASGRRGAMIASKVSPVAARRATQWTISGGWPPARAPARRWPRRARRRGRRRARAAARAPRPARGRRARCSGVAVARRRARSARSAAACRSWPRTGAAAPRSARDRPPARPARAPAPRPWRRSGRRARAGCGSCWAPAA